MLVSDTNKQMTINAYVACQLKQRKEMREDSSCGIQTCGTVDSLISFKAKIHLAALCLCVCLVVGKLCSALTLESSSTRHQRQPVLPAKI